MTTMTRSAPFDLSSVEVERYLRQISIPAISAVGQKRLKRSRVLVIGVGGIGSSAALSLASAGIGSIGILDRDIVEQSNLQRQFLYDVGCLGHSKVKSGRARLSAINPFIAVEEHEAQLSLDNAREIISKYDLVVDGTDNFETRYLMNDVCYRLGIPIVHGSVFQFEGQVTVLWPRRGPCYRCLYAEPPIGQPVLCDSSCNVLGAVAVVVGALQATEALKIILEIGEPLIGRLLIYDSLDMSFCRMRITRDVNCPLCGGPWRNGKW